MSQELIESYLVDSEENDVRYPLSDNSNDICSLISTKKEEYYIYTYDPSYLLNKLKNEYGIDEHVLSNFDNNIRTNCCNVISIMLYLKECKQEIIYKYLKSINRTVKNVMKNLNEWVVRVYFDISVYQCVNNPIINTNSYDNLLREESIKSDIKKYSKITKHKEKYISLIQQHINSLFTEISKSPNVEIYTFDCNKDVIDKINIDRTRTLRYLPLIDNTTNICIIRDADGIISNLDCHNIKCYQQNKDKLFYIPQILSYNSNSPLLLVSNDSYTIRLQLYKVLFEYDFFDTHVNVYDFLAGAFSTKLKPTETYYMNKYNNISNKIISIENDTYDFLPIKDKNIHIINDTIDLYKYVTNDKEKLLLNLNVGFDEILLLDIYKEIISVKIDESIKSRFGHMYLIKKNETYDKNVEHINNLFYANIHNIIYKTYEIKDKLENENAKSIEVLDYILNDMIDKNIIKNKYSIKQLHQFEKIDEIYVIDSLLIPSNILLTIPFNICIRFGYLAGTKSILELLNISYDNTYDYLYDVNYIFKSQSGGNYEYYYKYLKYKRKYLSLRNYLIKN